MCIEAIKELFAGIFDESTQRNVLELVTKIVTRKQIHILEIPMVVIKVISLK